MRSASTGEVTLLFGAQGQVGSALRPHLLRLGRVVTPDRSEADFERPDELREIVRASRPSLIVNAAAYTAVDDAEHDEARCRTVNAEAPRILAEEAARAGAQLVHFSTNYVFDGTSPRPYREDDDVSPINVYGQTKAEGEHAVLAVAPDALIFRLAAVYAPAGRNFLRRILALAREREELRVVDDQLVAPTPASAVASGVSAALKGALDGSTRTSAIYHLTCSGSVSWHGFAERIVALDPRRREHRVRRIVPVRSEEISTPARRPLNGLLDTEKLERGLGVALPSWETGLERMLAEYIHES